MQNNGIGCGFCLPPYINNEEQITAVTYQEIMYRLERIALTSVKWDGLPEEINPMILERYLYYFGQCVFYYDDILQKYLVLPFATQYAWDQNYYPTEYDVIGFMGYIKRLNYTNSVIIWNNYQMTPTVNMCAVMATRLTNTLRTSDMHLEALKIGKILSVPETKKRGVQKIIEKIKNYHLFTVTSPAGAGIGESVQTLDTEINAKLDQLDSHYTFLWHDTLAYLGYESINTKRSGVNILESQSDNDMASGNKLAVLSPRQNACKLINEMFGLNISVTFGEKKEGDGNGELYNVS